MKTFASAALAGLAAAATSDHWAVIMAGSNTYSNYRHQSDSHHAVKIMMENGIPRDQIIHLAYDDIAQSRYNPYPGELFNAPTDAGTPGVNVYDQSDIDYSGSDVNKTNFFNVLLGDDSNGPALKSDSNSRVFVYFVDHGGAGLICTPQSSSDWIYADELDTTLKTMKSMGMFKELVFYLETCESGSMFPNISEEDGIYAMTASNATLSSWGAYCGSEAYVDGKNIGSCLGDLFSINWMQDTESHDPSVETLSTQAGTVTELTTRSPVQQFGATSWLDEPIGDFQGVCEAEMTLQEKIFARAKDLYKQADAKLSKHKVSHDLVDSRDGDLHFKYNQYVKTGSSEDGKALEDELHLREKMDSLFLQFDDVTGAPEIPQDFDCLRMMVGGVEESCGKWSSYGLKYVRKLANMCDTKTADEIAEARAKIHTFCTSH